MHAVPDGVSARDCAQIARIELSYRREIVEVVFESGRGENASVHIVTADLSRHGPGAGMKQLKVALPARHAPTIIVAIMATKGKLINHYSGLTVSGRLAVLSEAHARAHARRSTLDKTFPCRRMNRLLRQQKPLEL